MEVTPKAIKIAFFIYVITDSLFLVKGAAATECQKRMVGDGFYCVCNQDKCDTLPKIEPLKDDGIAIVFETSQAGTVFQQSTLAFQKEKNERENRKVEVIQITLNSDRKYQKIIGFGAAFTDAAGINIASLPDSLQKELLKAYFSDEGSQYSLARIPIASSDFSTFEYSYDDHEGDFDLTQFNLTKEDYLYKLPFIKEAVRLTTEAGRELNFFSTPWAPPYWMKTNNKMSGDGILKSKPPGTYETAYAQYYVKFFQSYREQGINFWGTSIQNEPSACGDPRIKFQCLGFNSSTEADFLGTYLGPALNDSGFGDVKIMIMEDQKKYIVDWVEESMNNPKVKPFVSGVSFHWYVESDDPAQDLETVKEKYPYLFLLATEACNGVSIQEKTVPVDLGSWKRGEMYAVDIIEDLLHFTEGWMDWNLVLNEQGGPNYVGNSVDSPIIVNSTSPEFYKQPMYYVLAHFSKLLPPDSIRIGMEVSGPQPSVRLLAFQTPNNDIVVHALNTNETSIILRIKKANGMQIERELQGHSLQSFVFK